MPQFFLKMEGGMPWTEIIIAVTGLGGFLLLIEAMIKAKTKIWWIVAVAAWVICFGLNFLSVADPLWLLSLFSVGSAGLVTIVWRSENWRYPIGMIVVVIPLTLKFLLLYGEAFG